MRRTYGRSSSWALLLASLVIVSGRAWGLTDAEQKATRPADLGPATIDVSTYPPDQQENYKLFLEKCSRCHSPARPINSKLTTRAQWEHFVNLMHARFLDRKMGPVWKMEDGRKIIDFLSYDSRVRKIDQRQVFDEQQQQLEKRYADVQVEKAKLQKNQPTKPAAPYTGTP